MVVKRGLLVIFAVVAAGALGQGAQELTPMPLDRALKRATEDGKYRMLLRQIRVESDAKDFGIFHDFGFNRQATCAEFTKIPHGYWVYVYPYWYIWRDRVADEPQKRAWGPEQATGPADTPEPGDRQTAWASATQDADEEWLMLEYATPVRAYSVHIYETYNPGSIVRVTGFSLDGTEVELWRRPRAVVPRTTGAIFRPVFSRRIVTNRIKLYLDSGRVPGWNEIDAVRLRQEGGGLQWAIAAHASTTYGVADDQPDPREERIRALEEENRRLRQELQSLKRGGSPTTRPELRPGADSG